MRRLLLVLLALTLQLGWGTSASAAGGGGRTIPPTDPPPPATDTFQEGNTLIVTAGAPGTLTLTPVAGPQAGPVVRCGWYEIVFVSSPSVFDLVDAISPVVGNAYLVICWFAEGGTILSGYPLAVTYAGPSLPGPATSTSEAADFAVASINFQPPTVQLSPAATQIVGVPTWLAVTSQLDYASVNAAAGPVWASVRPRFTQARWDLGDGVQVVCTDDAATTWDPASGTGQTSLCTHTFIRSGVVDASVTITWSIEQLTNQNPTVWRPWGEVTLTTQTTIDVSQLQAVID